MRVVLTCNFSPWSSYSGGGQRSTHELATALARRGHDVNVVFTRPPWERFPVPQTEYHIRWAGFFAYESRRQAPFRPLNALSVARQVAELHRKQPIDVLHGNGEEVALAAGWAQAKGVVVVTTPRYPTYPRAMLKGHGLTLAERLKLFVTDPKYLVLAAAVKRSDYCCPTSNYTKHQVIAALAADPARLRVVPNGVAPAFLQSKWLAPSSKARAPLLFFGRLEQDKGVDVLLRALGKLDAQQRLIIAGRGQMAEELHRLADDLGLAERIEWRSWLDERALAELLAHAALAILPSRHESFGNAMAEAMAVGTPLVSTLAGSVPEVVKHEESGLLVPPESPDALAAAIKRLLDNPALCQQLSSAARARVREHFTWDRVAESYVELYESR